MKNVNKKESIIPSKEEFCEEAAHHGNWNKHTKFRNLLKGLVYRKLEKSSFLDDYLQIGMLRAYEQICIKNKLKDSESFYPYFKKAFLSGISMELRKANRKKKINDKPLMEEFDFSKQEAIHTNNKLYDRAEEIVRDMFFNPEDEFFKHNPKIVEIMKWKYYEGLSWIEMSERRGSTPESLRSRFSRDWKVKVKNYLNQKLKDHE